MPLNIRTLEIQDPAVVQVFKEIEKAFIGIGDNISGSITFATSATAAVVFNNPVGSENYKIFPVGNVNETFWVTNKTVTGFTANSSNANSVAVFDWLLIE